MRACTMDFSKRIAYELLELVFPLCKLLPPFATEVVWREALTKGSYHDKQYYTVRNKGPSCHSRNAVIISRPDHFLYERIDPEKSASGMQSAGHIIAL
jgi:hypothetical protein